MWRSISCKSTSAPKLNATGMPIWCSAAIDAGMSLARLIALIRVSSGAIGLAPSRSTEASSRPLAQKSPSSFCTLPWGACIALLSNSSCCWRARSLSCSIADSEPTPGSKVFTVSQSALALA